jgi:hypothetical protein
MDGRDGLGPAALGLRRYLLLAAQAVGSPAWHCEVDIPASAYLALDRRIPRHPDADVGLLWDERDGWAALLEPSSGDEIVLAFLGEDVLPEPARLVAFVEELYADGYPGRPDAPDFREPGGLDGFEERLACYTESDTEPDVCLP